MPMPEQGISREAKSVEQEKKELTEEELRRAEEILLRLKGEALVPLAEEEPLIDDDEFGDLLKEKDQ